MLIVAGAALMEGLDSTIIITALPKMAETFGVTPVALSIGLTSYLLTVAVLTPVSGWMADRFGARNVFVAAIAVFTAASVLCGLSQNLTAFTAARVLQGMGGALMTSVGRLIVFRTTPKAQLVRAINLMTVPMLLGPTLGPPIGGFLAEHVTWRAGFLINVPLGIVALVLVWMFFPTPAAERRRFDVVGFLLNGAALCALIMGLQGLAEGGEQARAGAALAVAAVPLVGFAWRHAARAADPLIDLKPLRALTYRMTTLTGGNFMRLAVGATGYFFPLMFQLGLGLSPTVSGLLVLAHMAGDMAVKTVTTRTVRAVGLRNLLIVSLAAYAAGLLCLLAIGPTAPLWLIAALLFVAGAARSFQMTGLTSLQFADVPQENMTSATTLSAVVQQGTRALGVALAALLLAAVAGDRAEGGAIPLAAFHMAFLVIGLFAAAGLFWYVRLPSDAGAAVSGHRPRMRPAAA